MSPMSKRWTLKETEFLRENMCSMNLKELKSHLVNRTEMSNKKKLFQLFTVEHVEKYKTEIIQDYVNNKIGLKALSIKYNFNQRIIGKSLELWNIQLRYRNRSYKSSSGKDNPSWKGYEEISLSKFNFIKLDADRRDIPFEITIEQIWDLFLKQERKCLLSVVEIWFFVIKSLCTASLDRKDSNIGYTIDNVQWVHKNVNIMKNRFSDDDYIKWCILVVNNIKEKEETEIKSVVKID